MTIRRYILGLTIIGAICGASPALAADSDLQIQNHDSCIVDLTGDVNLSGGINASDIICAVNFSGSITSADVIVIINTIFLRGLGIEPCFGAGDVNCSGRVTSADVIYLVNYVFKSGTAPCDICMSEAAFFLNCIE